MATAFVALGLTERDLFAGNLAAFSVGVFLAGFAAARPFPLLTTFLLSSVALEGASVEDPGALGSAGSFSTLKATVQNLN